MRKQSSATTTAPNPPRRTIQRWPSPERLSAAVFVALLALIEILPIQALLLMYAAVSEHSLAATFGPLWLIGATLGLFALARWRIGSLGAVWLTLAALLIGFAVFTLFLRLSPTAYGDVPGGLLSTNWLVQAQSDALLDTSRFNNLFSIAPIVVYLGWRGLTLGGEPPRIEPTLRRFTLSLTVVMFACLGALIAPQALQSALQSALLTLLALEVFAGLAAAALARRGGGRESAQTEGSGAETLRWVLTAFGAAALVIVVAFTLGLALNFNLLHALLLSLGPVGAVLNNALAWLTNAVAYLLWVAFVKTIGALFFGNVAFYITPPHSVSPVQSQTPHRPVIVPPPESVVVTASVLVGLVIAGVIVAALYMALRRLLRSFGATTEPEMDEEREALDARGLLRRQLRDWLARLRGGSSADEGDLLTPGGARWLYRELLRAGAAAGFARRPAETADEYSQRLASSVSGGAGDMDLAALTQAYDDARYGEREASVSPEVTAEAQRATTALDRLRASR